MIKRALISVYDKSNLLVLANFLVKNNTQIISTGGTFKYLADNGVDAIEISEITKFPEMLDGRVKTLHPNIHGGILAVRDNKAHMETIEKFGINEIDMVIVNLYPFYNEVQRDISFEEKIEFIDIGGPSMLRSAGKSFKDVVPLIDPNDYEIIIKELEENNDVSFETRKHLSAKVFNNTAAYDAAISNFLFDDSKAMPEYINASYKKQGTMRYGENPHQNASFYVSTTEKGAMRDFKQLGGKDLSFNNIRDMDLAWKIANDFDHDICSVAVKHSTPCGVAIGNSVFEAYTKCYECDSMSIFGGIVAINSEVNEKTAKELIKIFLEIVIAPSFTETALNVLREKKNLRIIECKQKPNDKIEYIKVDGGMLVQDVDAQFAKDIKVVTKLRPTDKELEDLIFAMKVCKYVKSNAIVIAKDKKATGIGGGQTNRIWAAKEAIERAGSGEDFVMASDAFFPFSDVVDECYKNNVSAIIQPGGSLKDKESIDACDKYGISMVFTNIRHFKH